MKPPNNLEEFRRLQGRLAYIEPFVANISSHSQSFSELTKISMKFVRDKAGQKAFDDIKDFLTRLQSCLNVLQGSHSCSMLGWQSTYWTPCQQKRMKRVVNKLFCILNETYLVPSVDIIQWKCLALVFGVHKMQQYLVKQAFAHSSDQARRPVLVAFQMGHIIITI